MTHHESREHRGPSDEGKFSGNEWILGSDEAELADPFDATIEARLASYGFDEDRVYKFSIALREAAANAIKHGNKGDRNKKVRIEWNFDEAAGELEVAVFDEGEGFDVKGVPDPTKSRDFTETSGRGIFMMRGYLGEENVDFEKGCTRLRMHLARP